VKRLKALCAHTASLENRDDIGPMTEKAKQLEEENMKLEIEKEVFSFPFAIIFIQMLDKHIIAFANKIHICKTLISCCARKENIISKHNK
jgi:transcription initiation factor IIF auxiliary subunit